MGHAGDYAENAATLEDAGGGGHSSAFNDARWLAGEILSAFADGGTMGMNFCLVGLHAEVEFGFSSPQAVISFAPIRSDPFDSTACLFVAAGTSYQHESLSSQFFPHRTLFIEE